MKIIYGSSLKKIVENFFLFFNKDSIKISAIIKYVGTEKGQLKIEKGEFRVSALYNFKKRRTTYYEKSLSRSSNEYHQKIVNYTQPVMDYSHFYLPEELVKDFFEYLNITLPKNLNEITLKDLAWVNRLQKPLEKAIPEMDAYLYLKNKIIYKIIYILV